MSSPEDRILHYIRTYFFYLLHKHTVYKYHMFYIAQVETVIMQTDTSLGVSVTDNYMYNVHQRLPQRYLFFTCVVVRAVLIIQLSFW